MVKIIINKGICYSCGKLRSCTNPEKAPDFHCDEWEYWQDSSVVHVIRFSEEQKP